jgi:hypothetical protein
VVRQRGEDGGRIGGSGAGGAGSPADPPSPAAAQALALGIDHLIAAHQHLEAAGATLLRHMVEMTLVEAARMEIRSGRSTPS